MCVGVCVCVCARCLQDKSPGLVSEMHCVCIYVQTHKNSASLKGEDKLRGA
jgi:hypothetical protein